MRYLRAAEVREALPMSECIKAMAHAFGGTRDGQSRTRLGGSLVLLGLLDGQASVKIVSTGLGDEAGIVAVFGVDGRPLGLVDGPTLSAIRTGAAPGLATDLLADSECSTLAWPSRSPSRTSEPPSLVRLWTSRVPPNAWTIASMHSFMGSASRTSAALRYRTSSSSGDPGHVPITDPSGATVTCWPVRSKECRSSANTTTGIDSP